MPRPVTGIAPDHGGAKIRLSYVPNGGASAVPNRPACDEVGRAVGVHLAWHDASLAIDVGMTPGQHDADISTRGVLH